MIPLVSLTILELREYTMRAEEQGLENAGELRCALDSAERFMSINGESENCWGVTAEKRDGTKRRYRIWPVPEPPDGSEVKRITALTDRFKCAETEEERVAAIRAMERYGESRILSKQKEKSENGK